MAYGISQARATADSMIRKRGQPCRLRRSTGDRDCFAALDDYSPRERDGAMVQATDRRYLVTPVGLDVPPDNELDLFFIPLHPTTLAEVQQLRIVAPPGKLELQGEVVYWELQVRE